MSQEKSKKYTVEQLQEVYALSLPKTIEVLYRFGDDGSGSLSSS